MNINTKLCALLGIEIKNVLTVDIALRHSVLPHITINYLMTGDSMGWHDVKVFELHEIEKASVFDIDAACNEAMIRVSRAIVQSCSDAKSALSRSFLESRIRLGIPVLEEHLNCLSHDDRSKFVSVMPISSNTCFFVKNRV